MRNLPKITKSLFPSQRGSENDDVFRGQHPDTRTNQEFLRDLENKLFVNRVERKVIAEQKRTYVDGPVMCVQTGEVFQSAAAAELAMGLTRGGVSKVLNGVRKMINFKYSFIRI